MVDVAAKLVGDRLYQVSFVLDYIQLGFDGAGMTLVNDPVVTVADESFTFGHERFAQALISLIGGHVASVTVQEGVKIEIALDNSGLIRVPLDDESYRYGPEAVSIQFDDGTSALW